MNLSYKIMFALRLQPVLFKKEDNLVKILVLSEYTKNKVIMKKVTILFSVSIIYFKTFSAFVIHGVILK